MNARLPRPLSLSSRFYRMLWPTDGNCDKRLIDEVADRLNAICEAKTEEELKEEVTDLIQWRESVTR